MRRRIRRRLDSALRGRPGSPRYSTSSPRPLPGYRMRAVRLFRDWLRLRRHDRRERFSRIYRENSWGDDESVSGAGSSRDETASTLQALEGLVASEGWSSLVDVGCGDFNWMSQYSPPPGFRYTGVDIVEELIASNRERFSASHPWASFQVCDVVQAPPPAADALLCRDVLYHLSFEDALRAISNCVASGAAHLALTSHPGVARNRDIPTGSFEFQNLLLPPFSLPDPVRRIPDAFGEELCLWRRQDLDAVVAGWR
ncbi:MAG: class I SAM-dependent methyltransferase [Acidobacteria bacterium]|nr:MAG: class I SAM-dependent methyltransferase [Acidobacteriota bacterium]